MIGANHHSNTYKANVLLLLQSRIVTHELFAISSDIATKQNLRHMEIMDAMMWIFKHVSLCWVFTNQVTYLCEIQTISYDLDINNEQCYKLLLTIDRHRYHT